MHYFGESYYAADDETYGAEYTQALSGSITNIYGTSTPSLSFQRALAGAITATGVLTARKVERYTKSLAGTMGALTGSIDGIVVPTAFKEAIMKAGRVVRTRIRGGRT